MSENSSIRYIYIRPDSKYNCEGAICIGYYFHEPVGEVRYTICLSHPGDRFSRKIAHSIIRGRFTAGKYFSCNDLFDKEPKYERALAAIFRDYYRDSLSFSKVIKNMPEWAKILLEGYRTKYGLEVTCDA